MNSIPILYYAGDASRSMDEFKQFYWNTVKTWRDIEQLCLYCNLDKERMSFVQYNAKLPKSVILKKRDEIDWSRVIGEYEDFNDAMVYELKDYIDFNTLVFWSRKVTEKCLRDFADKLDFNLLSRCRNLSFEFMDDFKDKLNWIRVTVRRINTKKIDNEFLTRFIDYVDWSILSHHWDFTREQVERYKDVLDWSELSVWRRWSLEEIRTYRDRIDWERLKNSGNWYLREGELKKLLKEMTANVS